MRLMVAGVVALAVVGLAGCGGSDGPTAEQKQAAKDFCSSAGQYSLAGMGLDPYHDTAGYKQCVSDAVKVTACLDDVQETNILHAFVPASCNGSEAIAP